MGEFMAGAIFMWIGLSTIGKLHSRKNLADERAHARSARRAR